MKEFRRLHRDLLAWFAPEDARAEAVVAKLAETWWKKRRRLRSAVGSGVPGTVEIDAQIDELLQLFVDCARRRSRKWRYRLELALGPGLYGPHRLRTRIEARLAALGGRPPRPKRRPPHTSPAPPSPEDAASWIERMLGEALERLRTDPAALETARACSSPGAEPEA